METKARLQHAMKNQEWPEKQRVWACLSLATMGFNQELAVKLARGQVVPLTQTDIANQTGIAVKNVHRSVLDLESEGWLKRTPVDEARGLLRGEVQIHCYAIPRPVKKPKAESEDEPETSKYAGLAPELSYWLRHLKLGVPSAENMEQALAVAAGLSAGVESFRELCRPEPDQMPLPGLTVNRVKVATLAKSKPAPVVELGSARKGEKSGLGLRAEPFDPCARALPNKEEIKEIKKKGESVGRSLISVGSDRPTESPFHALEVTIIETGICEKLKDTPSRKLLERIAKKLNGHPLEYLKTRIHLRFDDITGLGMLEDLAGDVSTAPMKTDFQKAREILFERPKKFSEHDKEWARGLLGETV